MELSYVEKKMLQACRMALDYLAGRIITRRQYIEVMDTLRLAVKAGEYKMVGCPNGTHVNDCLCREGIAGHAIITHKLRRKRRELK